MAKTNENLTIKTHHNRVVGFCLSAESIDTKGKLPQSTIGYPNQQLATFLPTIVNPFSKLISYTLSTISYTFFQSEVNPFSKLISYTLSTISYTRPQSVTLLCSSNNNHNKLKALRGKTFNQKSRTLSTISYPYLYLVTLYPQLVTLLSIISYVSSTISYTCTAISRSTPLKNHSFLKLLNYSKNLVKPQEVSL